MNQRQRVVRVLDRAMADTGSLQRAGERIAEELLKKAAEVELLEATCSMHRQQLRLARDMVRVQWILTAAITGYALHQQDLGSSLLFFLSLSSAAAGGFLFLNSPSRARKDSLQ